MFTENYNAEKIEKEIHEFWDENKIFEFKFNDKRPIFSIDTPPPTISGMIHVGHAMSYSQAEFIARYKRMRGFNVFYPMGFDDNGLPTERYVENVRNIRAVNLPRDEFIKICLEETRKGEEEFKEIWKLLGISVDWNLTYSTIDDFCRKISQFSFIDLYEKGRVYRAESPITWCPNSQCKTAVAQAELEDFKRITKLNYIKFKLENNEEIVIATTRPELLPACVGIFVNPNDKRYKKLIGRYAFVPIFGQKVKIMEDELVDPNFGTGIVMVCTFGDSTDIEWWKKYNLETKIVIDESGKLNDLAGKYSGLTIEEARKEITEDLKKEGKLIEQKDIEQTLNVHERCGTPIEYLISKQWWIKISDLKEKWLELGNQIKWYPASMKNRYDTWVNGLNTDWCISRQRYYGIPFPVWYCKKCGKIIIADKKDLPIDPFYQKPKKSCSCGYNDFEPEKSVMDTWATSAITPLINSKWTEKENLVDLIYPMSLRPQGHDIIRTWAFYTIAKCWLHTGKIPWNSIMVNGHGLDPHGKKMSKSKGNIVEVKEIIKKYSADALRYWAASAKLGNDLPFKEQDVARGQKIIIKLWNAAKLISNSIENYKPNRKIELKSIDKWLFLKLNKVINKATEEYEKYEYSDATAYVENFFWHDFCDNYLEIVKQRIYNGNDEAVKYTLYYSFLSILKLFAPILAHITEKLYQKLYSGKEKEISIHISNWPEEFEFFDESIERNGDLAIEIISFIRKWKHDRKIALNAELNKIIIDCNFEQREGLKEFLDDIKTATKAKEISFGYVRDNELPSGIKIDIS
ncbi:MAG: valine--tRNA ligase [Candidatus Aenigmatarchaeota archaeon]